MSGAVIAAIVAQQEAIRRTRAEQYGNVATGPAFSPQWASTGTYGTGCEYSTGCYVPPKPLVELTDAPEIPVYWHPAPTERPPRIRPKRQPRRYGFWMNVWRGIKWEWYR